MSRPSPSSHRAPHRHPTRGRPHPHPLSPGERQVQKTRALKQSDNRCVYCTAPLTRVTMTLDHVQPRSHGGTDHPANLVAACPRCNRLKSNMPIEVFFAHYPALGLNFLRHARAVHTGLKRTARRTVSLAMAA